MSFTPTISGKLERLEMRPNAFGGISGTLSVYAGEGTSGTLLHQQAYTIASVGGDVAYLIAPMYDPVASYKIVIPYHWIVPMLLVLPIAWPIGRYCAMSVEDRAWLSSRLSRAFSERRRRGKEREKNEIRAPRPYPPCRHPHG